MKTFLVLDGNSLLHRAWHAIPPLTTKDGRVVNAAYGFSMVVEKMREKYKPDFMAVAWDLPGKTFRHEEFEAYKATRVKKEDELYEQIPLIQEILDVYGVPSLSAEGMEADDIIGTIAKKYGKNHQVLILTGDLDSLQLVNGNVKVVVFIKGLSEVKEYDEAAIKERYGLTTDQLIDFKALMGDPSDNLPGLAGVGKKTATDLLQKYGSIKNIYKAIKAEDVPEKFAKKFLGHEKEVEQMQRLVTIRGDVKLPTLTPKSSAVREPNIEKLTEMFRDLGFRTLLKKYEAGVSSVAKPAVSKAAKTVQIEELTLDELAVFAEAGSGDLFGSGAIKIGFFDGKKSAETGDVKAAIKLILKAKRLIGHDVKAMNHLVSPSTRILSNVFDTMVASYLLSPGSRQFDLATCLYDHVSVTLNPSMTAAEKAKLIFDLAKKLERGLEDQEMKKLSDEIEMPLIPVLFEMERHGIHVDEKHLHQLSKDFGDALEKLTKKIYKLAGREFNINSPSQLAEILFDELKLPSFKIKKTKSGFSTAASELEKLWDTHKIIPLISEYRELAKLKSTYADSLPELVADDHRIHTTYNQTIAATGRLSSVDPNLQNIPIRTELGNEIRKAFVAPAGKVLVAMDYSQFELRLAAVFAKDKSFIDAFNAGADVHRRTAAEVLGIDEDKVTDAQRYAAKAINFGILYGMGARNLARSTGFSQDEARAFLERYFEIHPGIRTYIDEMKIRAHQDEYAETLFGRRRYLPDINSGIQMLVAAAERMAVNMPVQGTQADLVKMAMLKVAEWIEKTKLDVKMLLQVHDELVFEIKKEDADEAIPKIRDLMVNVYAFDVPLVVNVETGKNWGETKEWSG